VQDPTGAVLGKHIKQSTGQVAITVEKDGRHEYCFSNQMSAIADKMVRYEAVFRINALLLIFTIFSFNVHGVIYVSGNGMFPQFFLNERFNFVVDVVEPIEREIRKFAAGLGTVKDEQEYMMIRERTHRNTAESTNSRVKWWSILQSIVLFSVVGWQVWYLKVRSFHFLVHIILICVVQSFFEVKRII
jgi:hypothetical protein